MKIAFLTKKLRQQIILLPFLEAGSRSFMLLIILSFELKTNYFVHCFVFKCNEEITKQKKNLSVE